MQENEELDQDNAPEVIDETPEDPIAAKWEEIQARMKGEGEEVTEEGAEQTQEAAQRTRDERGRFASTTEAPEAANTPSEPQAQPEAQPEAAPPEPGQQWDINRPPASLSPAAKAEWDKLPESWRREIHKREADVHRGVQQILPDARFGQQLRQMAEPYRPFMEAAGLTPEQAVSNLLRADAALRTGTPAQKAQTLRGLAQHYGVDPAFLEQGAEQQQQQHPGQFYDPRVDQILAAQQRADQEKAAAIQQQYESEVGAWLSETDAQGKPLRPFVDNVMHEVIALIPAIQQQNPGASTRQVMEDAYARAVWANPATRAVLTQQQLAELEASRRAENLRRVEEAKKAASVNVARRGVVPPRSAALPMNDFIAQEASRVGLLS